MPSLKHMALGQRIVTEEHWDRKKNNVHGCYKHFKMEYNLYQSYSKQYWQHILTRNASLSTPDPVSQNLWELAQGSVF